jgi:hypothetical protein
MILLTMILPRFFTEGFFDRIISDREDGKLVIWNLQNDSVDK